MVWFSTYVFPMGFECFLKYHFSKVGDQTLDTLTTWIEEGTARHLPTQAIAELKREACSIS